MTEINGARIEVLKDYETMSYAAANHIGRLLTPSFNMLVPTGTTPEVTYAKLSEFNLSGVNLFNYDAYCEFTADKGFQLLDPEDPRGYQYYMAQKLPGKKSHFPGIENIEHRGAYDKIIAAYGGIDLALNAIGEDGHTFGFNFPGSSPDSKTRLVEVNQSTRQVNEKLTNAAVPQYAITTGLATGMEAKKVVVLVSGKRKAGILAHVIHGETSTEVPATILREHPDCTWFVDEAAAAAL